jgi:hypothetical protein
MLVANAQRIGSMRRMPVVQEDESDRRNGRCHNKSPDELPRCITDYPGKDRSHDSRDIADATPGETESTQSPVPTPLIFRKPPGSQARGVSIAQNALQRLECIVKKQQMRYTMDGGNGGIHWLLQVRTHVINQQLRLERRHPQLRAATA